MGIKVCSVIIIEPSEVLAAGLSYVIRASPNFVLSGVYTDLGKYRGQSSGHPEADLVIINPLLIDYNRRNALKSLFPGMHVVALLYNYLDKELLAPFHEVIEILDKPAKILHKLERAIGVENHDGSNAEAGELSDREKEILVAVAKGMINKEIASFYNISIHTVISHRKNISRKTGIKSVSGFGVYALLNNLIEDYEIQ